MSYRLDFLIHLQSTDWVRSRDELTTGTSVIKILLEKSQWLLNFCIEPNRPKSFLHKTWDVLSLRFELLQCHFRGFGVRSDVGAHSLHLQLCQHDQQQVSAGVQLRTRVPGLLLRSQVQELLLVDNPCSWDSPVSDRLHRWPARLQPHFGPLRKFTL